MNAAYTYTTLPWFQLCINGVPMGVMRLWPTFPEYHAWPVMPESVVQVMRIPTGWELSLA